MLSQSHCLLPDNAMSDVQHDGRRRLTDIGTLTLRGLALAVFSAAIGAAAAILVHPSTVGSQLFEPSSAVGRSAISVSVSPLEQVAAKVLPSVVTLQTDQSDQSELGSGIILTADGLIMTNSHVVASDASVPPESGAVVTFHDGRTAAFTVVAIGLPLSKLLRATPRAAQGWIVALAGNYRHQLVARARGTGRGGESARCHRTQAGGGISAG